MSFLILGKDREDPYFFKALEFVKLHIDHYDIVLAKPGESLPEKLLEWQGDYIISYLCPWVIPDKMLISARKASINFHPGPPEYPGTGCTNFAIYNEETIYGVTCHYMAPEVDSGRIILVSRFPILESDTVYSVTQRCYAYMLTQFYNIMTKILSNQLLPESGEAWTKKAYRYKDLVELKRISPDMDANEIKKRIRAVTYPGYVGAYIDLHGYRFILDDK